MPSLHREPNRHQSALLNLAAVVVVVAALYFGRDLLIPLALATLLCFVLAPLATLLQRWVGRVASVVITVVLSCGVLGTIGWLVTHQMTELATMLPRYKENIRDKVTSLRGGSIEKAAAAVKEIRKDLTDLQATRPTSSESAATDEASSRPAEGLRGAAIPSQASAATRPDPQADPSRALPVRILEPSANALDGLFGTMTWLSGPLGSAAIIVVLMVFMLLQREDLRNRVIRLIGQGRVHSTTQAVNEAASRISRYLLMQSLINGIHGACIAIGLSVLGLPNALLWGILAFVLRFVPYLGPFLAAAMPILLSLAVYEGWSMPLAIVGFTLGVELISNNVLEPWLFGSSAGASSFAIILTAVFWTWLWGTAGLLLATPLTVCLIVLGKHVHQLRFLSILLGDEPVLEPHVRFYQRLLSLDSDEAMTVVEKLVQEKRSLVEPYDDVVLPALRLAQQDRQEGRLDGSHDDLWHRAAREVVDELGERAPKLIAKATPKKERAEATEAHASAQETAAAAGPARRVVCCSVGTGEADEIATVMLQQCLLEAGITGEVVPGTLAISELPETIARLAPDVLCLSGLGPVPLSRVRGMCKVVRSRLADLPIVVGLWASHADVKRVEERLESVPDLKIATSLAEAIAKVGGVVARQDAATPAA